MSRNGPMTWQKRRIYIRFGSMSLFVALSAADAAATHYNPISRTHGARYGKICLCMYICVD